jgi:N-carbamoyl-L-amino-acid hydrolase
MNLTIDQARVARELDELAAISQLPPPAVTRIVFTDADLRARAYVKGLCREAGLEIREDSVGNIFARWQGVDPFLPAVGTGSHIDAIPNAGKYDGTVGVLGGLEALRALGRAGFRPPRSIELIIFTAEEPTRFGIGCLGSRLMGGALTSSADGHLKDNDGRSLQQVRTEAGYTGALETVRLPRDCYRAFVELHIEQGPILERDQISVGIVTAIAAPAGLRLWIEGEGGHAGAVLMSQRHDAFLGAAEVALSLEKATRETGAIDTVATTGVCDVFPGAMNSIPSRVRMDVDVRDIDPSRRDEVLRKLDVAIVEVSSRRGLTIRKEIINQDSPAQSGTLVLAAIEKACLAQGATFERMISRAYHDALFMSLLAPSAMLFIPCRSGISHHPDEYVSEEHICAGIAVLAETLADLAVAAD